MRSVLVIGIVVIGIIGGIAVFASMPSDTWQDKRTDVVGVAPPDENADKIECLSNGRTWDGSCSIVKSTVETREFPFGECLGNESCLRLKVSKIIDGDTIVADSYKIRLSLVDTPEKDEPGFFQATSFTTMSCPVGSMILVDQDDLQPYDVYSRMLGKVYCEGGVINEMLLQNSHAVISTQYCKTSEFSREKWAQDYGCAQPKSIASNCDESYPDFCIMLGIADLDCGDISERNFRVFQPDPHRFDGNKDGIGCEK